MVKKLNSLTIFFPCYKDEKSIGKLVRNADAIAKIITDDYEIIVVNDASPDNALQVLQNLQGEITRLRIISHAKNKGYGGAIRSGFDNATKEFVFYTDGDGQYDVMELPLLTEQMTDSVDVVNGWKIERGDGMARKIIGNVWCTFVKLAFGIKIKDVDCDFRLIRKKVLDTIELETNTGAICTEFVKKTQTAGLIFSEVGVNHYPRMHGSSQFLRSRRILDTFLEEAKLWIRLHRSRQRGQ